MSKELTSLEAVEEIKITNERKALKEIEIQVNYCNEEIGIFNEKDPNIKIIEQCINRVENLIKKYGFKNLDEVETALKEKELQDNVIKVLKEVIAFGKTLPQIKPNKDNGFDILSAVVLWEKEVK